jgi:hypothetical protein
VAHLLHRLHEGPDGLLALLRRGQGLRGDGRDRLRVLGDLVGGAFSSSIVAVVSWTAVACWAVEFSFCVAAASTSALEAESWMAASRISVTKRFSVSITWPTPAMSGVSAASVTARRRLPVRSPWPTRRTIASMASSTPRRTASIRAATSSCRTRACSAATFTTAASPASTGSRIAPTSTRAA